MRMGDGGFRPAYNAQLAADTDTRLIVGVYVTNVGSDYSQLGPMIDHIEANTGHKPDAVLVDGGFVNHAEIDEASARGVTVYAPPKKPRHGTKEDAYKPRRGDSEATAEWRDRMGTAAAKKLYKERAATIETVNADAKAHRGLDAVNVRGLDAVTSVLVLGALGYNAMRIISLGLLGALA